MKFREDFVKKKKGREEPKGHSKRSSRIGTW